MQPTSASQQHEIVDKMDCDGHPLTERSDWINRSDRIKIGHLQDAHEDECSNQDHFFLPWFIADNLVIYHPCAVPSGWEQWATSSRFRRFQIHFGDVRVVLTARTKLTTTKLLPFHSARSNIF